MLIVTCMLIVTAVPIALACRSITSAQSGPGHWQSIRVQQVCDSAAVMLHIQWLEHIK